MTLIIKYIATVYTQTGEIKHVSTAPGGDLPEEGVVENSSPEEELIYVPSTGFEDVDLLTMLHEYRRKDGNWLHKGPRPTQHHEWNVTEEAWQLNSNSFWTSIRQQRNEKLALCDWTQMPDARLNSTSKSTWATYRQQLRDVPTVNSNVEREEDIGWPTPPE